MPTIKELRAVFTAQANGLKSAIRSVRQETSNLGKTTQTVQKDMDKTNQAANNMADSFDRSYKSSRLFSTGMDATSRAIRKIQKDMRILQMGIKEGLVDSSVVKNMGKIQRMYEEQIRTMRKFRVQQAAIRMEYMGLGASMGDYKGSTEDFMKEVERLGKKQKNITDEQMKQDKMQRASFLQTIGMMEARTNASKKMMEFNPSKGVVRKVDNFFLGIGNRLENIAKKGHAATLALRMLGPNANMKKLNDLTRMINQGLMRTQQVALFSAIGLGAFTAGMIKLSNTVDGRLKPAANEFKKTWLKALTPFAKIWTDFALLVLKAATKVGDFINKLNEIDPSLSKAAGMFAFLATALSLILSPMAIGIGRAKGMLAAFSHIMMIGKPLILGFTRIAGIVSVLSAAIVILVGAFMKMWHASATLRGAVKNAWDKIKQTVTASIQPILGALKQFAGAFVGLINVFTGGKGNSMKSFWKSLGDIVGGVINKIVNVSFPYFKKGFELLAAGLTVAIKGITTGLKKVTDAVDAVISLWNGNEGKAASLFETLGLTPEQTLAVVNAIKTVKTNVTQAFSAIEKEAAKVRDVVKGVIALFQGNEGKAVSLFQGILSSNQIEEIKNVVNTTKQVFGSLVTYIKHVFVALKTTFYSSLPALTVIWKVAWFVIKNLVIDTFNAIKNVINGGLKVINGIINIFKGLFTGNFRLMWQGIKDLFTGAIQFIWGLINISFAGRILKAGKLLFTGLKGAISAGWGVIKGIFSKEVKNVGGIFGGIKKIFTSVWGACQKVTGGAVNWIKSYIKGDFDKIATDTTKIFNGILTFMGKVWGGIKTAVTVPAKAIWNGVKLYWGFIKQTNSTIFGGVKTAATKIWGGLKTGVVTAAKAVWSGVKLYWGWTKKVNSTVFDACKKAASVTWDLIKKAVTGAAKATWKGVKASWDTLKTWTSTIFNGVKDFCSKVWGSIKIAVTKSASKLYSGVKTSWDKLKSWTSTVFNSVKKFCSKVWGNIKKEVTDTAKELYNDVKSSWNKIRDWSHSIFNALKTWLSKKWDSIKTAVTSAASKLYSGIKDSWNKVKSWTHSIFNDLKTWLAKKWGDIRSSVSKAADKIWSAIKSAWDSVKKKTHDIFNDCKTFLSKTWEKIRSSISKVASKIWGYIRDAWNNAKKKTYSVYDAIKTKITSVFSSVWSFVSKTVGKIKNGIYNAWKSAKDHTVSMFDSIWKKVSKTFGNIVDAAKKLPGRIGDGIRNLAYKAVNGVKSMGNKLAGGLESVVNGVIGGVNKLLAKIGIGSAKKGKGAIPPVHIPRFYKGTGGTKEDGPMIVGDKGPGGGSRSRELVQFPDGSTYLSPNQDTLIPNAPKGTKVLSNKNTEKVLSGTDNIPKFKDGNSSIGDFLASGWNKVKNFGKAAIDKIGDVWSYVSHPGKLVNKVIDALGVHLPKGQTLASLMTKGLFNKLKDGIKNFVSDKLSSLGGGMDVFGPPFRMTSPYGMRWGKKHEGVDFAAPMGTPVKSATSGTVKQAGWGYTGSGYGNYGNVVSVLSGAYELLYTHLSKVLAKHGQHVNAGQVIGKVGSTGNSTGPHTHFEIRKGGRLHDTINPLTFLKGSVSGGKVSGSVAQWIRSAMARAGVSGANWINGLSYIIQHESSGNPRSVGAMTSSGTAKGLMQLKDFNIKGDPFNPVNNIYWGIKYIRDRYHTINRAVDWWKSHHWYKNGTQGFLNQGEWAWVGEEGPELRYLPQGSRIYSHRESMNMVGNGLQDAVIVVQSILDGKVIAESTYDDIDKLIKRKQDRKNRAGGKKNA